jgi:hypothetical protein
MISRKIIMRNSDGRLLKDIVVVGVVDGLISLCELGGMVDW